MSSTALEAPTISHLELEQRINQDDVDVIDVRDLDYFIGHIPGARHVPSDVFDDAVPEIAKGLLAGRKLCVVYCLTGRTRDTRCALDLIQYLVMECPGYEHNVRVLKGGFSAWEKHFGDKNVGGRYISRRLCLDQYSLDGFPSKEGIKKMKKHPATCLPGQTEQANPRNVFPTSTSAWAASADISPMREPFPQQQCQPTQGSNSSEKRISSETWRSRLTVGDKVQVRSRGSGKWRSGVIIASNNEIAKVSLCQGKKAHIKIVSLHSPDLQPHITSVGTVANSPSTSETHSDASSVLSDSDCTLSCYSDISSSSNNAASRNHLLSGKRASSTASSVSGAQIQNRKAGSSTASSVCGSEFVDVPFMSQIDLARRLGQDNLQIFDARDLDYFRGHIIGACHTPCAFFEDQLEKLAVDLATSGKTLVFYCGESKDRAPWCARRFVSYIEENFPTSNCNVYLLKGGFKGWIECCAGSDDLDQYIQVPGQSSRDFQGSALPQLPSEDALPLLVQSEDTFSTV